MESGEQQAAAVVMWRGVVQVCADGVLNAVLHAV